MCGCKADVGVIGVLMIGVSSSRDGKHHAHVLRKLQCTCRAALVGIDSDKIASIGFIPRQQILVGDAVSQLFVHIVELWTDECRNPLHMTLDVLRGLEVFHVAYLIDLIMAEYLQFQPLFDLCYVFVARSNQRYRCAGEGDLRRRSKIEDTILSIVFLGLTVDVQQRTLLVEMMHTVGIVPEYLEVSGGRPHLG